MLSTVATGKKLVPQIPTHSSEKTLDLTRQKATQVGNRVSENYTVLALGVRLSRVRETKPGREVGELGQTLTGASHPTGNQGNQEAKDPVWDQLYQGGKGRGAGCQ